MDEVIAILKWLKENRPNVYRYIVGIIKSFRE